MLNRLFDIPGSEVRAYDGRGGDGGRDVLVRQGSRLRIFQLKYFRDGFGGERRSRRTQITRSFHAAMDHRPNDWVLVIPTNPTPGEEAFVQGLAANHANVSVTIMGRAELDSRLGLHIDLVDYFTRDQLREAARIYGQEPAMLFGGLPDLTQRHRDLARIADSLDKDWAIVTTAERNAIAYTLRPKHPRAAEVSPINLTIETAFGPQHKELAAAFRRVVGFGVGEQLTLPSETVRALTITGPNWLPAPDGPVEVTFAPTRPLPERCATARLALVGADGKRLSTHQAEVRGGGSGPLGYSIEIDCYGTASLKMLIGEDGTSQMDAKFAFGGVMPTLVLNTAALFRDLQQGHHFDLDLDGQYVGRFTRSDSSSFAPDIIEKLAITELLAGDLEVVQRHCRNFFPVPTELSLDDRVLIRVARLLIEGHCVVYPAARSFEATLNGLGSSELREVLKNRDPSTMRASRDLVIEIDGRELALGEVTFFHPNVVIPNAGGLMAALNQGRGAGKIMRMVPINRESFRAVLPSARLGRDDEPLRVTGWGLPGLDGPPGG